MATGKRVRGSREPVCGAELVSLPVSVTALNEWRSHLTLLSRRRIASPRCLTCPESCQSSVSRTRDRWR